MSNEVSNTISVFSATPVFRLQLLHFADAEAGLLASQTAPNLAALVDAFEEDFANTLILSGGDNYIPGPFFAAGTDASVAATHNKGNNPGAADIKILNRIGVQASTVGNHEFDIGTNAFSDIVGDAAFPYLTANLDFSADDGISGRFQETVGVGGLEDAATLARKIVPSAVVNTGGEQIGLVGATTQIVEGISSTGNVEVKGFAGDGAETNDMVLLAAQLQPVIDDLIAQGVNKIIVMAHLQQIALEQELATLLRGVDIILAGGSNTRLGDDTDEAVAFPGHAADFAGTYPIVTQGADGGTTLIVNTDNEYTYLGRLVLDFDAEGRIILDSLNEEINGAYAATEENVAAAWGVDVADLATTAFAEGTKGAEVAEITDAVQAVIEAQDGNVFGFTDVYLEGERNIVRNQETNLGNITADANKVAGQGALAEGTLVASLKNAGGIRAPIGAVEVGSGDKNPPLANPDAGKPEGGISQLDASNTLRFNNLLLVFDTTAAGLKAILEHGVASLGNQGRFPQIGGIAFGFDPDLAAGSRITSISAIDENGVVIARLVENGVVSVDAPASISVVTLNFLANGGDGYPIKANGENFRYLLAEGGVSAPVNEALIFSASDAFASVGITAADVLSEQQAFAEFLSANHGTPETAFDEADTGQALDTRIQNLNFRADTVLDGQVIFATLGDDNEVGTAGDDLIVGYAGADTLTGGLGDDVLAGREGDDLLFGDAGRDRLRGGEGNDTAFGGAGNDSLYGEAGDDLLFGGDGIDILRGGEGADTLSGGAGRNILDGGLGADAFLFETPGIGRDRITGFDAEDMFLISANGFVGLTAGVALTAGQFTLGNAAVGDDAQFIYNTTTGRLAWDANGDDAGGVSILAFVVGAPTITAADFTVIA